MYSNETVWFRKMLFVMESEHIWQHSYKIYVAYLCLSSPDSVAYFFQQGWTMLIKSCHMTLWSSLRWQALYLLIVIDFGMSISTCRQRHTALGTHGLAKYCPSSFLTTSVSAPALKLFSLHLFPPSWINRGKSNINSFFCFILIHAIPFSLHKHSST